MLLCVLRKLCHAHGYAYGIAGYGYVRMCFCFDDVVHDCSLTVLFCKSSTDKFMNFACGIFCCHFLPRKLNKTINNHIEYKHNYL